MSEKIETPIVGTVVKSTCGRDRKRVFIVLEVMGTAENMRLWVADGRLRPVAARKLKNPRHVKPIGHLTECEAQSLSEDLTDAAVREILSKYDSLYRMCP